MSRITSTASPSARRRAGIVGVFLAVALLAAACASDDDDEGSATTSTTAEVADTTTTTAPSVTVDYTFDTTASESEATQAAGTMTRRLEKVGYPGSVAVVNDAGSGLEISVTGVETDDEARGVVSPLTIAGVLTFRPILEGPLPPAAGETASPDAAEILGSAPTTAPGAPDEATTTAADDDPAGSALLIQPDANGLVIARWRVGPSALGGSEVEDSEATTFDGNQAVQITLADTDAGIGAFNAMGQSCFDKSDTCPTGAYAVVFDSLVATASAINTTESEYQPLAADAVIIHSPAWSSDYALALAVIVEVGAMPVGLTATT